MLLAFELGVLTLEEHVEAFYTHCVHSDLANLMRPHNLQFGGLGGYAPWILKFVKFYLIR